LRISLGQKYIEFRSMAIALSKKKKSRSTCPQQMENNVEILKLSSNISINQFHDLVAVLDGLQAHFQTQSFRNANIHT
jgi:hypothetical protein